jgi:hypothetical protein
MKTKLTPKAQAAVDRQVPKVLKKEFEKAFVTEFEKIKDEMIAEFLSHPVTVELKGGPSASNISGTLGGVSNLFGFIGFEADSDPIDPIFQLLNKTKYSKPTEIKSGLSYTIQMPTAQDIFDATPMPWASGRSWAKGIESGISGIGYLLRINSQNSRSGVAIQTNKKIRSGKFSNVPYISYLIKKYEKKFSKLT